MSQEELIAFCGALVVLLGVSESLPFMRRIKANGVAQLVIAVIRAIASQKPGRR